MSILHTDADKIMATGMKTIILCGVCEKFSYFGQYASTFNTRI